MWAYSLIYNIIWRNNKVILINVLYLSLYTPTSSNIAKYIFKFESRKIISLNEIKY